MCKRDNNPACHSPKNKSRLGLEVKSPISKGKEDKKAMNPLRARIRQAINDHELPNIALEILMNQIEKTFGAYTATERFEATCAAAEILNNTDLTDQVRINAVYILGAMAENPRGGFAIHALMLRKEKKVITPPLIAKHVNATLRWANRTIPAR